MSERPMHTAGSDPTQSEERRQEIVEKLSAFAQKYEAVNATVPVWVIDYIAIQDDRCTELEARVKELEDTHVRLLQERMDYSGVLAATSNDGLNSSEWIWRTGKAEREAAAAQAREARLREALEPWGSGGIITGTLLAQITHATGSTEMSAAIVRLKAKVDEALCPSKEKS